MPIQSPDVPILIRRILNQQGRVLAEASKDLISNFASPSVGSPAWQDRDWADTTDHPELVRGAYTSAAQTVATLLRTMEEYRCGILALLESDQLLALPIMNCARAIHDAALRVCWLSDPGLRPEERLARAAADFLATVQGGIPVLLALVANGDDDGADLKKAQEARAGAIKLFRSIGLTVQVKEGNGQAQNVRYADAVANVEVKVTDLSLKYTPITDFSWRLNSGATHSSLWLTNGLDGPWSQLLISMTFPLLDISDALTTNLWGYSGMSTAGIHKETHTRRILLLQRAGVPGPYGDHAHYQST